MMQQEKKKKSVNKEITVRIAPMSLPSNTISKSEIMV